MLAFDSISVVTFSSLYCTATPQRLPTSEYPQTTRLLTAYMKQCQPTFLFTSIQINVGHAAKPHVDWWRTGARRLGTSSHGEPDRSPSLYADSLFDGRGGTMQFKWRRRWLANNLLHISAHSATNFNEFTADLIVC